MTFVRNFWKEEEGQDLIEYALLLAFVALASATIFIDTGTSLGNIWTKTKGQLDAANAKIPAAPAP